MLVPMVTGIQGQILEVRVVGCNRLTDTKWIRKQNPYVYLEYGGSKFRTKDCKDGGRNPNFHEKFHITLVEGLGEINVGVWNNNTVSYDNLIGSGRVQLQKVLSEGFDDSAWPILSKSNTHAGEVCLTMHYPNAKKQPPPPPSPSPAPQCCAVPQPPPQVFRYPAPPAAAPLYPLVYPQPPAQQYPPQAYPPQQYPPQGYPPSPNQGYPPQN